MILFDKDDIKMLRKRSFQSIIDTVVNMRDRGSSEGEITKTVDEVKKLIHKIEAYNEQLDQMEDMEDDKN